MGDIQKDKRHWLAVLKTNWRVWGVVSLVCAMVAVMEVTGQVDPDFYSYNYVSRGVIEGKKIYKDFTDNKGPMIYLYFAGLGLIFGENLKWILGIGSFAINLMIILGLVMVVEEVLRLKTRQLRQRWWLIGFMAIYVLLTYSLYGINSENLAMGFVIWAIVAGNRKKYWISAILFAMATLTRQTVIFFGPYFAYIILIKQRNVTSLLKWVGVFLGCWLFMGCYGYFSGELSGFLKNAIIYNFQNFELVKQYKLLTIIGVLFYWNFFLPILGIATILLSTVWLFFQKHFARWEILLIIACSMGATFLGGVTYIHHLLQMAIAFWVAMTVLFLNFKYRNVWNGLMGVMIIMLMGLLVASRYPYAVSNFRKLDYKVEQIKTVTDKEFLMVVTFHPKLYYAFNKSAPDKYFQPCYLSKNTNLNAESELLEHELNLKDKLTRTAFVLIKDQPGNKMFAEDYLARFKDRFEMKKVDELLMDGGLMEVYWAGEGGEGGMVCGY